MSCTQLYVKLVQYGTTQSAIAGLNPVAYFLHYLNDVMWLHENHEAILKLA